MSIEKSKNETRKSYFLNKNSWLNKDNCKIKFKIRDESSVEVVAGDDVNVSVVAFAILS